MREVLADLRFALRLLRKSPGFTTVAVTILALGLGANTAIFTLVNRVMLRPLPYPRPDELMALSLTASSPGMHALAAADTLPFSYPKFRTLVESQRSFSAIAGFSDDEANLTGAGDPERIRIEFVTGRYFDVLEIRAKAGRLLAVADDSAGAAPTIVVSSDLAGKLFGSSPASIGKLVSLNGVAVTVAGVAPGEFAGAGGTARAWVPMALAPAMKYPEVLSEPGDHWFQAVGRRRSGVSEAAARQDILLAGKRVALAHPTPARFDDGSVWGAAAIPFADARRDPMLRRSLSVLFAAVGAVLLLASGNIAALVLARGAARRHEIAVRVALGASPGRIRRQLLAESLLLAALGAAAGIGTAILATRALVAIAPPRVFDTGISASELLELSRAAVDGRVLAFTCLLALGAGVLIGMVPAWRAARLDPGEALKSSGRTTSGARGGRSLLAGAEIALSLVLLLGGGLLVRSLLSRYRVPLGFRAEGVATFSITPSGSTDSPENARLHERLVRAITAIPGVESAAIDVCSPLSAGCNRTHVKRVDGRPLAPGKRETIGVHLVSTAYFRTLDIPLRRGRGFSAGDRAGTPRVAIVNETAARRIWPGQDPVGRRIELGMGDFKEGEQAEVVGVVGDVHYGRVEAAPIADAYLPDSQVAFPDAAIAVRTQGDPSAFRAALREAVRRVDPNLPISEWRTLRQRVSGALAAPRFAAALLSGFALFAVLLAALGIYGLLAQIASERTREIGIRIALGAKPSDVFGMMLRGSALIAAGGVVAGLVLFAPVSRALGALLFGIPPSDPATIVSVVVFLVAVALVASLAPARRAARIDPVEALRQP
jgi:putative ABC transport system permease protein